MAVRGGGLEQMLFKGTKLQREALKLSNKSSRPNAQHSERRQQYHIVIVKLASRLEPNYSNHWK